MLPKEETLREASYQQPGQNPRQALCYPVHPVICTGPWTDHCRMRCSLHEASVFVNNGTQNWQHDQGCYGCH